MSTPDNLLFTPIKAGAAQLQHRIVMAPLTRNRADSDLCPTEIHAEYYSQRATPGGLLISEATVISPQSIPCPHIPGIWTEKQAQAWKVVVDRVHQTAPGSIFALQGWHQGRLAHPSFTNHPLALEANAIVGEAPSAIAPDSRKAYTWPNGTHEEYPPPKAMTADDIVRFKAQFIEGARLSLEVAGFDIYELHGAHQYALDVFFNNGVNQRTDEYGGSLENRFRIVQEILDTLIEKYPGRIAIRISPHQRDAAGSGVWDTNPVEMYTYMMKRLAQYDLAYLLVTEPRWIFGYTGGPDTDPGFNMPLQSAPYAAAFRALNSTTLLIGAGGFSPLSAYDAMEFRGGNGSGGDSDEEKKNLLKQPYDAIAFGRFFISNPDLVYRLKHRLPLTLYDRSTFYITPPYPEEAFIKGFTDYPTFEQIVQQKMPGLSLDEVVGDQDKLHTIVQLTQDDHYKLALVEQIGRSTINQA